MYIRGEVIYKLVDDDCNEIRSGLRLDLPALRHVRRVAQGVRGAEMTVDHRSDHMQAGIGAIGYHDTTVYTKSRPKRGHCCERPGRPAG